MSVMDAVLCKWSAEGVQLNPAASTDQLARLEAFIEVSLPRDVREYFEAMNGMPEEATTQDGLTRFWPIERILNNNNPDATVGSDQMGKFRDIAFADGYLGAWFLRFRVRGGRITILIESKGLELRRCRICFGDISRVHC